jgi:hypothetical protein
MFFDVRYSRSHVPFSFKALTPKNQNIVPHREVTKTKQMAQEYSLAASIKEEPGRLSPYHFDEDAVIKQEHGLPFTKYANANASFFATNNLFGSARFNAITGSGVHILMCQAHRALMDH